MKKILVAVLMWPLLVLAQSYPSPTLQNLTVLGSFTGTGIIGLPTLAAQAANTVVANVTGSSASPTAFPMPSCSAANSALKYTSGTGWGCGTTFALTSGNLSQFASTTSAQLAGVISDETGTGSLVFGTNPSLAGLTSTGTVAISSSSPLQTFNSTTTTLGTLNFNATGGTYWQVQPTTSAFPVCRYSAGTLVDCPFSLSNSSGLLTLLDGLAVTGAVSGTGFSNYLASPPAIGGTTPGAGSFTSLSASTANPSLLYNQGGTGAVNRTYAAKFGEVLSVMDFGALCNGSNDDTSSIQAAITYGETVDATVTFPVGTCKITSALIVNKAVTLRGSLGGSVIAPNFATGDAMSVTVASGTFDGGATIQNLEFKASVTRTGGYYINLSGSYNTLIEDCIFTAGYNGVGITGAASQTNHIRDSVFANTVNDNIDILNASADVVLTNLYLHGAGSSSQSNVGINITAAGDVTLQHIATAWLNNAVAVIPGTGQAVQALFIDDSFLDTGNSYGLYVVPSGTGVVQLLKISNSWVATNNLGGILLGGGAGTILQTDIINTVASNNLGNGLFINTGTTNTTVIGGSFSNNSSSGIAVAAGVTKFKIIGATSGPSGQFNGNGQWGILVNSGASDNYFIQSNYLCGNTSGGLSDGGTGTNKEVWPNVCGSGAVRTIATPSTDWGVDFSSQGAIAIASSATYQLAAGSGLLALANNANGDTALFLVGGGTVTKVAGAAEFVAGAAGASQIGVTYSSGNYFVGNGWATSQNIYMALIKIKPTS